MIMKQQEPIAIVGSACRFPGGASSPSAFWELLKDPRDLRKDIGAERFDAKSFYHPDGTHHGTSNVLQSYLLDEDVRAFDAPFFNLSPNEADAMDPQQRILLEVVYEALESGGHVIENLRGSNTAVYVGTMTLDYNDALIRDHNTMPSYYATGTSRAIISNRVSYFFDWHGPSMTIDTACSSSLIALHQGVQSLRNGECRVAVACGTQLLLGPEMYIGESTLKMLSPNGRSAMWDADADGYARGEGMAAVVVKRLSDAIADGDRIECIVRETGANQDGYSNGITVPNPKAQADLIRQTYARAGLDPENVPQDRPQFFEAHGTGTQAGDPREATAIHDVFGQYIESSATPLYVGSVKTVIGHLEGCAGLAGILKGSAMVQSGQLPPNLHFHSLNPKLEPFINGLKVSTKLRSWPQLADGLPRRVSVNSFGFGGTNAHAIIEEYKCLAPLSPTSALSLPLSLSLSPFVFSGPSESALVTQLQLYSNYLEKHHENVDRSNMIWTLHSRRSQFSYKAAFSATTLQQLATKIDAALQQASSNPDFSVGFRPSNNAATARILGVFTGQGAQWPAMGAHLIRSSAFVNRRIEDLEQSLATLPQNDRPTWSLRREMLAGADTSRIAEAALSQPLCTAIQVVLVDLLRAAGIKFAAVVGHSSGEIGAAYAAGFLTAKDAIRVAYYRGFTACMAGNVSNGQKGAMLAVGTSLEDAQQLVDSPSFRGRLAVAAHNSPASVTLSGDADAVAQAKKLFDEEKKFARLLKVDTAYHSHHMLPCGDRYVQALRECGVKVIRDRADTSCTWYSSVTGSSEGMKPTDALRDEYWRDNMTNAVLFSDAVKNAITGNEQIDLAIEVGPHPALKGPAIQNVAEVRFTPLPYCGILSRGANDVEAFSEGLGFIWTRLPSIVKLSSFEQATADESWLGRLVTDLPSYQWNHAKTYWSESRISKRLRTRKHGHHEILGFISPDSNSHEIRWLNIVKPKEISWLAGHRLQSLTVFPAAGYVAMALEASRVLAGDEAVILFELHHLSIPKAMTFEEGQDLGVETLVSLTGIQHHSDNTITAEFACYFVPVIGSGSDQDMQLSASGNVKIALGAADFATIPSIPVAAHNLTSVDADRFYDTIAELGYDYSGPFKTLSSAKRRLNHSSVLVDSYTYDENSVSEYLVHPTMLDVAFQASMLAYSAPGDQRLWSLSVPTAIGTVRVNPEVCAALPLSGTKIPVSAIIDDESETFSTSIDAFSEDGEYVMLQVEDLLMRPFAPATKADDRVMFTNVKLDLAMPDCTTLADQSPSQYEVDLAIACERITHFNLRTLQSKLEKQDGVETPLQKTRLLNGLAKAISLGSDGRQSAIQQDWVRDTTEDIQALKLRYSDSIDIKLLEGIQRTLTTAIQNGAPVEQAILELLHQECREKSIDVATSNSSLAKTVSQVVHRYPHARILEIGTLPHIKSSRGARSLTRLPGGRTGEATDSILDCIGQTFSTYTFTDRSDTLFDAAAERFNAYRDKMSFGVLNIEESISSQGFKPQSFDIIVVSHVLTSIASPELALANARQLLRPGGYLLLAEMTNPSSLYQQSIHGLLSGLWFDNHQDRDSTILTPRGWHTILRKANFSGVDTYSTQPRSVARSSSIIVSQAIDERVQFMRRPLTTASPSTVAPFRLESLVILGNGSLETSQLTEAVQDLLEPFCDEITVLENLPTEQESNTLNPQSVFVNLMDLESPCFEDMTDEKMDGIKRMLELAKGILWITHGGHLDQPYQMASIAFVRTLRQEAAHINVNHMDVSDLGHDLPKVISEYLVQQCALDDWVAPPSVLANTEHSLDGLLWSREPEVFYDAGKLKIPRLVQNIEKNARLNSYRRVVSSTVTVPEAQVGIDLDLTGSRHVVDLVQCRHDGMRAQTIEVLRSTLQALRVTTDTFLFMGITRSQDGRYQATLSTTNSSEVAPTAIADIPEVKDADIDGILVIIASELVAESLTQPLTPDSHILLHCSNEDRFLAAATCRRAATQAIRVTVTYEGEPGQKDPSWLHIDARAPQFTLHKVLRQLKPTHFLDLTRGSVGLRILEALPTSCVVIAKLALSQGESYLRDQTSTHETIVSRLESAISGASLVSSFEVQDLFTPLSILQTLDDKSISRFVRWPSNEPVEVEVRPLGKLFSKNKTYLLAGLSGPIGQSLAEWMISEGAGCVCLTSRNPKIDKTWLESFSGTGSSVKAFPMDILDKNSIANVVKEIRASCPPIAGVANGAVIFHDQLFSNMSGWEMRATLAPKIDGSKNLDEIFYDDNLEFFILFSSAVCIYGNAGQANYSAANGFLNSLSRQRRKRGLAASTIALGMVVGIGHAENAGQAVHDQLVKKFGLPPVSETDLHQIFAETVLSGSREEEDPVVVAGLRTLGDDEDLRGPWFSNSFFSHMVIERETAALGVDGTETKASLPISQQLALATDLQDALGIIQDCASARLRVMLQLGDQKIEHDAPLLELGIDSLVAVEVRSWFLKELKVDIPVLKIVGGASLTDLCNLALGKLPQSILSSIGEPQEKTKVGIPMQPTENTPLKSLNPTATSDSSSASEGNSSSAEDGIITHDTTTSPSLADAEEFKIVKTPSDKRTSRNFLKSYSISLPQSRFWFLRHLLDDPTFPNVVLSYHISGNIRVGDFERALRISTNRHEALRTCFVEDEDHPGEAYQRVLPSSPARLERKKVETAEDVDDEYNKLRARVFELEQGDVVKMLLLTQSTTTHYLMISYHHIIMDGASFSVFFSDLEKAYMGQSLGPVPRQYPEFSVAQRRALDNGDMGKELQYWRTVFPPENPPPVLPLLPMARTSSRVPMKDFDTHQVLRNLDPALVSRIRSVAKAQRSTPFHLHLAAYKAMLFCLAGDDTRDLTIGIADAARNEPSVERSVGFFLNLLTLRFHRKPDQSFADAIVEARNTAHAALATSRLPFDVLLSDLNITRSALHSPFFQAFIDYRQGVQERHVWGNCEFEFQQVHAGRTAYDVTLDVSDWSTTESLVVIRTQKSLYDLTAANLLLDTYIQLLEVVTSDASLILEKTPVFGESQLAQATLIGRGLDLVSDWPATLPHRIEQIAGQHADKIAIQDGRDKVLTYSDMIRRTEAISEALQCTGAGYGSRVLVFQEPAADWICSMLAIMRIGAIYVPLNLREPIPRLAAVAKDCKAATILADTTTFADAPQLEIPDADVINVSALPDTASKAIPLVLQAASEAAILYTSGSTGTPKGITVTHAGLRNEIEGYTKTWALKAERALQQSAFTFNHSSDQIYTGLVNGGMVYVVPAEKRGDPIEITKIIQQHGITYTKATPSEYSMWVQFGTDALRQAHSWRMAFGGGESLTTAVTDEITSLDLPHLRFHNSYGPTEISISSHKMTVPYRDRPSLEKMGRIPCGYSLPNYLTYIVDANLQAMPVGMPGEICIGGAGVSLGYLNNKDLTKKHFVSNPFATPEDISRGWTQMYRTGDIGHLTEDGALVFHGRMAGDSQVKIRGLRIELSDIESNMLSTARGVLKEVVVTLHEGETAFLVAHVVFGQGTNISDKESYLHDLLNHLTLPQYMIPVMAFSLDKLPLNNHSKVDRKAVKAMLLPERTSTHKQSTEMTETMIQLQHVWRNVIGINMDKIGVQLDPATNFFLVGGNSLLIIRLQAKIRQIFHVVIPLTKLMGHSTLEGMARDIEDSNDVDSIDWEHETAPPSNPDFLGSIPSKDPTLGKTILITGATGFMGKHLLRELLARPDVDKIHVVAVRDEARLKESSADPKISHHVGDLALTLLGLNEHEFSVLAGEVDTILHLGAVRSFWDNYHVLRRSNVGSVKELIKLAAPRHVPIHFISTVGVLPQDADLDLLEASSAALHIPPSESGNGYVLSKWAGERVLERAGEVSRLPSRIYRFLPASSEQPLQKQELMNTFLRLVDATKSTPDMGIWSGRVDLIPMSQVAPWLADSVVNDTDSANAVTKFIHCRSSVYFHTDELSNHVARFTKDRTDLPAVPILQWLGRCKAHGFDYMIASQQATVGGDLQSRR